MENLFVSYEITKLLKEKGFNEPCIAYHRELIGSKEPIFYINSNNGKPFVNSELGDNKYNMVAVPMFQQVIDWLEIKGVSIWAFPVYRGENIAFFKVNMAKFYTEIDTEELFGVLNDTFNTKKEALNKSIEEALKLI
jgi:hypothetical protein